MATRRRIGLTLVACVASTAGTLSAQSGFGLELRAGAAFATTFSSGDPLSGPSIEAPEFRLWPGDVNASSRFDAVLFFPSFGPRIRPLARVSIASGGDMTAVYMEEDPRCPTCTESLHGDVGRVDLSVGAEVPLFAAQQGIRPYANVGLGMRTYEFSHPALVASNGRPFDSDSFSETEFLARLGLGAGYAFGSREVSLELGLNGSRLGAGVVHVEIPPRSGSDTPPAFASDEIDFGRETVYDLSLSLGLRQNL